MDLSLNINGNASGATAAFSEAGDGAGALGEAVGKSAVKWQELANVAKAAASAVVKFGIDSVKAYAESEKIQRQLVRVSGDYADALGEQAEALSRLYAVDDDVIKQSQVLLTQWGGVGAASKEVTEAALNMAAAFGGDVNTATEDLIRNVESGGTGLAKMGIHFKATGDKGKDLAAAVAAINEKLGGAASANAASLTGSLESASLAFGDLQKSIGASITSFLAETGVINGVTGALRTLNEFITQNQTRGLLDEGLRQTDVMQAKLNLATAEQQLKELKAEGGSDTLIKLFQTDVDNAQAALDKLVGSAKSLTLPGVDSVSGKTNKGQRDAASAAEKSKSMAELNDASMELMKKHYDDIETVEETARRREEQSFADSLAAEGKHVKDTIQTRLDGQKAYDEIRLSEQKKTAEHAEKLAQEEMKARDKASKESVDRAKKQEQDWKNAGDQIGAAFVNALGDQLQKLAAGEEFDAALFVGDILAATISIAATVIGTAYGQPALGAAVGNLAAMGVRAGASAISANNKKKKMGKYHEGGWVGDEAELPRFHSGAWIAPDEQQAILQRGERVLSRREVASMGGPRGVDAAAKGGMGISVSVMAIDAKNAAEGFVGNLGLGLKRALRTGQGDVPRLLGVSPR